ncbi:MAG: VWA domain-containing protein, partial [Acidobacteriota bacterium]
MTSTRFGPRFFRPSLAMGLGLLLGLSAAEGQRRRTATDTVVETTDVLAVEIPVQVLQDGKPVTGLTRDDFQLVDERKKQDLLDFEVIDLRLDRSDRFWDETDTESIPLAGRRHFMLLFDLSFSDPTAIVRARDGAKKLILESLHPADMAGVVTFSESRGVNLVLNFTSDRRQMMQAIDELGLVDPIDRPNTDPLRVSIGDLTTQIENLGANQQAGPGVTGDLRAELLESQLQTLQDSRRMAAVSVREQKQSQIQTYMNIMSSVGQMLRQVKGSTHVVLLSEGFDSTVLLGNSIEDQARIQQIAQAAEGGRYWEIDSNERYGSTAALFGLTQVIEEFRRSGAAIQAVDIGGLRATDIDGSAIREAGVKQDGLFVLANDTGGELFRNYNDFGQAMGEMLERSSVTYLLTYQPKDLIADGRYRNVEIKLKSKRKGVR